MTKLYIKVNMIIVCMFLMYVQFLNKIVILIKRAASKS
ncbi:hypothetical protein B4082_5046 [Bacillus cereus]|uniref:Uncharacterized protein n=1 Tax=Bacillus cereus TaxID=1396 RepID=A0A161SY82_BACCE|nr:hypothetical protein B4082_5046 [Bacillus cereus]